MEKKYLFDRMKPENFNIFMALCIGFIIGAVFIILANTQ